jgi:hypothetical protein
MAEIVEFISNKMLANWVRAVRAQVPEDYAPGDVANLPLTEFIDVALLAAHETRFFTPEVTKRKLEAMSFAEADALSDRFLAAYNEAKKGYYADEREKAAIRAAAAAYNDAKKPDDNEPPFDLLYVMLRASEDGEGEAADMTGFTGDAFAAALTAYKAARETTEPPFDTALVEPVTNRMLADWMRKLRKFAPKGYTPFTIKDLLVEEWSDITVRAAAATGLFEHVDSAAAAQFTYAQAQAAAIMLWQWYTEVTTISPNS